MLEIYTPMAGGLAEEALNSLALLVGSGTFHSAINIAMTAGIGGTAYQYITGKKLENLMRFIFVSFTLLFVLIGIKVPVAIIDMQQPMVTHEVDDVPLGAALPASFISQIGYAISQGFEDVFHMPDDQSYNKTGMLFGSRIALAASSASFGSSPDLSMDLSNYMRQCILISKMRVTGKLTATELKNSPNLMTQLFDDASPVYRVILHDVGNVSCQDAAKHLKTEINAAADKEAQVFANKFTNGDKAKFETSYSNAQDYYLSVSQTGAASLAQNMLIDLVRNSVSDAMAFSGNTAGLMNYVNTSAMNNLRISEANTFWMAGYRLPMLNACLWILMICLFPVVILLAFFPMFEKAYLFFVSTMIWLWSWPPMFAILHFFVSYYASTQTNIFGKQDGGLTMSNIDPIAMIHSDMAFTAGFLAMSIPFIAKGLTSGMSAVFSQASQLLGSVTQGAGSSAVAGAAQGNISVGQFSAYNQNYDNINAHKHDLNSTDYRGMHSQQLANGSIVSTSADGHRIINSGSAMSNLAVGVQGSQALSSSLTASAQQAHHRGDSLRTSADNSLQSGLRQASNFSSTDGNDYRAGGGMSNTDTYGINQDYRHMAEAVRDWNAGHDASHQISLQEAISASASAGFKLFGNGGSVGGKISSSHEHGQVEKVSEFLNSRDGQSFSESYSHALNSAKNIHLDGSNSHQLSAAEQSAVDLNKAQSLSHQASTEYSNSENYSKAASIAESNSQSINTNMNSDFVQWAETTKGASAQSVLSATEGQGLQTQQAWATEYLNSTRGQSMVNHEAQQLLNQVKGSATESGYNTASSNLSANHDVSGNYEANQSQLKQQAQSQMQMMSKKQIEDAQRLQRQASHQNMMKQASVTQAQVQDHAATMNKDIQQGTHTNKNKVKDEFDHGVVVGDAKRVASGVGQKAAEDLSKWINNNPF
ncbi:MAG: conjugal transfer protein TraG N-terminal domain-containing protein [Proteobacteria bacterium]|nr:conjugal transfer protein TraG N-terminal domain-containing protein [Pseudomonadota bacterium]